MPSLQTKLTHSGNTYLINMGALSDGSLVEFDATTALEAAVLDDSRMAYYEDGPAFVSALREALEYADYVTNHATAATLQHYNTEKYAISHCGEDHVRN